jgi:hypothetical protein
MLTAAAKIELMNSRVGRGRGQAVEPNGLEAQGTIGSAPATLMMSRAPQSAHHRTDTRLQPIAANPQEIPDLPLACGVHTWVHGVPATTARDSVARDRIAWNGLARACAVMAIHR